MNIQRQVMKGSVSGLGVHRYDVQQREGPQRGSFWAAVGRRRGNLTLDLPWQYPHFYFWMDLLVG